MKLLLQCVIGLAILLVGLMLWMNWPVRLPVPTLPTQMGLPAANPPAEMAIYALPTGSMHGKTLLAYRGGPLGESRDFAMTAYLVRHPRGDLLIDSGLGSRVDAQFARLPVLLRTTSTFSKATSAASQLVEAGIDPSTLAGVLLTHAHWDHVSGLTDLPGVPVWMPEAEVAFVKSDAPMAALAHSMTNLEFHPYVFKEISYLGYPRSLDVWGDGSIVLVPAPGHTPGSVIVFVTLSDARYAFIGDIVWQMEGIERPAERPWLARQLVDSDPAEVREQIEHLAALHLKFPQVIMVPAHDARPTSSIPRLGSKAPKALLAKP